MNVRSLCFFRSYQRESPFAKSGRGCFLLAESAVLPFLDSKSDGLSISILQAVLNAGKPCFRPFLTVQIVVSQTFVIYCVLDKAGGAFYHIHETLISN